MKVYCVIKYLESSVIVEKVLEKIFDSQKKADYWILNEKLKETPQKWTFRTTETFEVE